MAIAILAAGNILALVWYTFQGTVTFLGGATMAFISTFLTTALAAVVFPYVRRELYEASPWRKSFLGIPVLTIAGGLTIVMLGAMVYAFLTNSTFGANGAQSIEFFIGFWVIGLAIYLVVRCDPQPTGRRPQQRVHRVATRVISPSRPRARRRSTSLG